jgi:hypothetical protein
VVPVPADAGEEGWWMAECPLTAEDFARQEEVFAVEQEARDAGRLAQSEPPAEEEDWFDFDDDCAPVLADVLGDRPLEPDAEQPAPLSALFPMDLLARELSPGSPDGPPFARGTALDTAPPGAVLAGALERFCEAGFAGVSDDQLAGVMLAATRLQARATAHLTAAVSELAHRRGADPDHRVGEATDTEIAITLALTRRAAGRLLGFATDLDPLPATRQALWDGRIDPVKAELIGYETGLLDPELAAAVEQLVIEDAPRLTSTALRARLRRAVLAADPAAARRRVQQAKRDARVELYDERSGGTAALAGRDLPVAGALAADQRIDATARALKKAGVQATLAQLRAAVFLGLLTGGDPRTFLPPTDSEDGDAPAEDTTPATGTDAQPTTGADGRPDANGNESAPATPGGGSGHTDSQPAAPETTDGPDEAHPRPADEGPEEPEGPAEGAGGWPGKLTLRGSVHLTLPLATWLGASLSPGEITGLGPATAGTCQDVADWIAENPGTRWCLTLTSRAGHAVAHGCATQPPPPAAETERLAEWLARLKISPIQAGDCTHAREVPGYRPPRSLHHAVQVRQKTCVNPVCGTPAHNTDDDHTLPYDQGGRTCECDLGPGCRKCHQVKQTPGWRLEQPTPGVFIWRLPNGRTFRINPGIYPT